MAYRKDQTVEEPVTRELLVSTLRKLGLKEGQIIEVHASLSSFDYVIGGARTIVDSLMEVLGHNGTILMPTQTNDNSEPSLWQAPAVQPYLYREIRNAIPPYDVQETDIPGMGAVADNFRHREGVMHTNHPAVSYAAWGRYAKLLCNRQSLHFPLAEESPAARLYELKGYVLLIGVDFDKVTSMHLAEYRTDDRPIYIHGACMNGENGPEWVSYLDLDVDSSIFLKVRNELAKKNVIREMTVGGSHLQFFPITYAIDEATNYFEQNSVYELYR